MSIVKVDKINKKFGKKQVLHDVSFEINEGEILGFIGPNGAGKTTTIKLMLGLQSIDSGSVTINGYDLQKNFAKAISGVGGIIESPDIPISIKESRVITHISIIISFKSNEDSVII